MKTMEKWLSGFLTVVALGLSFVGAPLAQTTTTVDVRNFEVIAVDGARLVFRDQKGTHEITVPDDFRFTVDGKKLSVKEMKAGMKGQATVTSKTTVVPVTVTEIRQATVVDTTPFSLTVRGADGLKRFTQEQLDQRGVKILKDGNVIGISDLRKNDVITATIVSKGTPVSVTEKEVEATLAQAKGPATTPAPTPPAATAAPATPPAPAPTPAPAATTAPAPSAPATTTAAATPAASPPPPPAGGTPWVWFLVAAIVIVLGWFFVGRKKKQS